LPDPASIPSLQNPIHSLYLGVEIRRSNSSVTSGDWTGVGSPPNLAKRIFRERDIDKRYQE